MPPRGIVKYKKEQKDGNEGDWTKSGRLTKLEPKPVPYPQLFDRSERTQAITFSKPGDLSYFTPVQRIASFMDFGSSLTRRHLLDLI
jgi:dynein heavy chain